MARSFRLAVLTGLLAALVIGTGTVFARPGDNNKLIDSSLTGLPQTFVNQFLDGVKGGGHAWTLQQGDAKLGRDGHIDLHVHGLVLFPTRSPAVERSSRATGAATSSSRAPSRSMRTATPTSTSS